MWASPPTGASSYQADMAPDVEIIGGFDVWRGANVGLVIAACAMFLGIFRAPLLPIAAITLVVGLLGVAGCRFRVSIAPSGIELRRTVLWIIPVERSHFGIDASTTLWEAWMSDPDGVSITTSGGRESYLFGPASTAGMNELRDSITPR